MRDAVQLGREVTDACRGLGFALAGVCEARASDRAREMVEWLEAGRHGSMAWMERRLEERLSPQEFLEGARSMVLVGDVYGERGERRSGETTEGTEEGSWNVECGRRGKGDPG